MEVCTTGHSYLALFQIEYEAVKGRLLIQIIERLKNDLGGVNVPQQITFSVHLADCKAPVTPPRFSPDSLRDPMWPPGKGPIVPFAPVGIDHHLLEHKIQHSGPNVSLLLHFISPTGSSLPGTD
jgi:hypothetical protein